MAMRSARRRVLNACLGLLLLLVAYNLIGKTSRVSTRVLQTPSKHNAPHGLPAKPTQNPDNTLKPSDEVLPADRYSHFPVSSFTPLPTGPAVDIPNLQHDFQTENASARTVREKRLAAVKEAFVHSWQGYKEHAWLYDELAPVTGGYKTTFGGWAASLVDNLDTLWIMDMKPEFEEAVAAASKIDFNTTEQLPLNVFETTIRYLGGFLGAYDVSNGKYPVLLQKATEVGEVSHATRAAGFHQ